MGVQLTKDSIDLGIVVTDAAKALAFYTIRSALRTRANCRSVAAR